MSACADVNRRRGAARSEESLLFPVNCADPRDVVIQRQFMLADVNPEAATRAADITRHNITLPGAENVS